MQTCSPAALQPTILAPLTQDSRTTVPLVGCQLNRSTAIDYEDVHIGRFAITDPLGLWESLRPQSTAVDR